MNTFIRFEILRLQIKDNKETNINFGSKKKQTGKVCFFIVRKSMS